MSILRCLLLPLQKRLTSNGSGTHQLMLMTLKESTDECVLCIQDHATSGTGGIPAHTQVSHVGGDCVIGSKEARGCHGKRGCGDEGKKG